MTPVTVLGPLRGCFKAFSLLCCPVAYSSPDVLITRCPSHPSPLLSLICRSSSALSSSSPTKLCASRPQVSSLSLSCHLLSCSCLYALYPAPLAAMKSITAGVAFRETMSCLTLRGSPLLFSSNYLCISRHSSVHVVQ